MPKRVLLIHCGPEAHPQLMAALGDAGAEVEVAQNPLAAYPKLWKGGFDMVIADMGADASKQDEGLKALWRAKKGSPRTEIVVLADYCGPDLARHAQELGVAFFLSRDAPRDALDQALGRLGPDLMPV